MKEKAMKRKLSVLVVLTGLLFLTSQANGKDTWNKVQSKNFTLVGNVSESDMRKIAYKLEQFRETLSAILPNAKISTPTPTTVVLFKSDQSFRPFKPRYQGKIKENVGGYFLPARHMNYIVLSADKESVNPYEIIFHEYEHYVLHNNLANLPLWLDEGLAEFYSSFTIDGDTKFTLGAPIGQHVWYLRDNVLLPFKTLLAVDRKSPHYNESSKAGMFYAESWALVHYLMNGEQQKRQPQLMRFINLVNAGTTVEESFQKAFQIDFTKMQAELENYVRHFTFPILIGTFRDRLNIEKDMTSVQLSEAESDYYQGDLLLNMRQLPEAKVFLEKSIALDPKLSASRVSLGILQLLGPQQDEAAKMFQTAIENDAQNYLAHYYYAEMLAHEERYEDAIKSYKQAISLKPDLSFFYSDLGYTYLRINNEEEAIKTFEKGIAVNSKEGNFSRSLAYIYFRRGNGEMAASRSYNYLAVKGWRDEHSAYMAILWYLSLRQLKNNAYATKNLQDSLSKLDPTDWPYPVVKYLLHQLTLAELMSLAKDNDQQTEAHAYAGFDLLFTGDREAAIEQLHWVRDKGNRNFVEHGMAVAELARLEQQK